ncbi:MAG: hypothetical protein RLZZ126_811 [Pseudomonadota bacterium]|jgi:DNA-binding GntR family transcriptional regulator
MNAPLPADLLKPRALYQEVAERLRQRIFARELAAGAWIDELAIAKELGISRTPLREALKVLAAEGLVEMKVRRGAYVAESNERDLREVYHLLALLESDAAAQAAENATPEQLAALAGLHQSLESASLINDTDQNSHNSTISSEAESPLSATELGQFFDVNERFHQMLLEVANNRWRSQMVADLRKVMKLNRHHSLFKTGRVQESLHEHRAVMAALQARDATAAAAAMKAHFASGLEAAS